MESRTREKRSTRGSKKKDTSPATNLRLDAKTLIPNLTAKNTIAKLLASGELEETVRKDWEERKRGVNLIRAQKLFGENKIEEAAELDHAEAQGIMADRCFGTVDLIEEAGIMENTIDLILARRIKDIDVKCVYWAKKAAAGGDGSGQFRLGYAYDNAFGDLEKNYSLAVKWYKKSADQGCFTSMNNIVCIYHTGGYGVTKDLKTAVVWFRKSATEGFSTGEYNLGSCYYIGTGVAKDLEFARCWFQKSADNKNSWVDSHELVDSQRKLGVMMMKGEGGEQDIEGAAALWKKAAAQGDVLSQSNLEKLKIIDFRA